MANIYSQSAPAASAACQPERRNFLVAFTLVENSRGHAAKKFELSSDGTLTTTSAAQIWEGRARRITVTGVRAFMLFRAGLQSNQALAIGVTDTEDARLVAKSRLTPGLVARDGEHFSFADGHAGVLMLDYDVRERANALTPLEFDTVISEVLPEWARVEHAIVPSSSAHIYEAASGVELIGRGGLRAYFIVDDASAIPDVGAFIYQALWERGHGHVQISASGALLDLAPVDTSVWQPQRLDFAASPVLAEGLERKAPKPIILAGAPMLITAGLRAKPMSEWRRHCDALKIAREKVKGEAQRVSAAFIKKQTKAAGGSGAHEAKRLWTEAVGKSRPHGRIRACLRAYAIF